MAVPTSRSIAVVNGRSSVGPGGVANSFFFAQTDNRAVAQFDVVQRTSRIAPSSLAKPAPSTLDKHRTGLPRAGASTRRKPRQRLEGFDDRRERRNPADRADAVLARGAVEQQDQPIARRPEHGTRANVTGSVAAHAGVGSRYDTRRSALIDLDPVDDAVSADRSGGVAIRSASIRCRRSSNGSPSRFTIRRMRPRHRCEGAGDGLAREAGTCGDVAGRS